MSIVLNLFVKKNQMLLIQTVLRWTSEIYHKKVRNLSFI